MEQMAFETRKSNDCLVLSSLVYNSFLYIDFQTFPPSGFEFYGLKQILSNLETKSKICYFIAICVHITFILAKLMLVLVIRKPQGDLLTMVKECRFFILIFLFILIITNDKLLVSWGQGVIRMKEDNFWGKFCWATAPTRHHKEWLLTHFFLWLFHNWWYSRTQLSNVFMAGSKPLLS